MGWRALEAALGRAERSTFGDPVLYTPRGGTAKAILASFSEYFESIDAQTGAALWTQTPNLTVLDADLSAPPAGGDSFVYPAPGGVAAPGAKTYRVENPQYDGTGETLVFCKAL